MSMQESGICRDSRAEVAGDEPDEANGEKEGAGKE
jgi:hypothetical protein